MRIACISTSRIPSDTANSIQVMKTCHALRQLGHAVTLILPGELSRRADWPALADRYGLTTPFEIAWLPTSAWLKRNDFAWTAVRFARRLNADLIYTWTGQSAVWGLRSRCPVAYEIHDLPTGRLGPLWFRGFLRSSGKKRLLPITRALLTRLENRFGPISRDIVVISPNGVDLDQYANLPGAPEARRALGLPERLTVSCSGHLYAGRGADLFLGLAERFPQANFIWVGGRPEDVAAYQLKAGAARLGNVTFLGYVNQSQLPRYQAAAEILLMPYAKSIAGSGGGNSADICSPMKMFDYLAAGRAILSSDLPVIREVLNEKNAVFAPPEDLNGWASALRRMLEDNLLRQNLAQQACRDAEMYTWLVRAEHTLAGFEK